LSARPVTSTDDRSYALGAPTYQVSLKDSVTEIRLRDSDGFTPNFP
jgi:hypothetical protein